MDNITPHNKYVFAHLIYDVPEIYDYELVFFDSDIVRFHTELANSVTDAAEGFISSCGGEFACADFSHLWDDFDDEESEFARNLIKERLEKDQADSDHVADDVDDDCRDLLTYSIVWRIVRRRINKQSELLRDGRSDLQGIGEWTRLFNSFIESAVDDATLGVHVGDAKTFSTHFLSYLRENADPKDRYTRFPEFLPFLRELESLHQLVQREDWPRNDVQFGQFLEWVRLFQCIIVDRC